jgi:CheY-like chemotaxis protein
MRATDDTLELIVRDTGQGIRKDFLPRVFDRFTQGDGAITRVHGGLGLGLAIVRHLVELHGGSVHAESEGEGRGATFHVRLPIRTSAPEVAERPFPSVPEPRTDAGRLRTLDDVHVLVVDDDADARELLMTLLQRCGARVSEVDNAADAFEFVVSQRPDLIVSDIGLPNEDGYSFIARVRKEAPERGGATPAVAVSGYARQEDERRAIAAGFDAHLSKPIKPAELVALLAQLRGGQPATFSSAPPPPALT